MSLFGKLKDETIQNLLIDCNNFVELIDQIDQENYKEEFVKDPASYHNMSLYLKTESKLEKDFQNSEENNDLNSEDEDDGEVDKDNNMQEYSEKEEYMNENSNEENMKGNNI